jgi:hypothetical protein
MTEKLKMPTIWDRRASSAPEFCQVAAVQELFETAEKMVAQLEAERDAALDLIEETEGELECTCPRCLKLRAAALDRRSAIFAERDAAIARRDEVVRECADLRKQVNAAAEVAEAAREHRLVLEGKLATSEASGRTARSLLSDVICCLIQEANEGDGLREEHYTVVKNAKAFLGHAIHEDCLLNRKPAT